MFKKVIYFFVYFTMLMYAEVNLELKQACQEDNATACYLYALPMVTGENEKIQDMKEKGIGYMRQACVLDEYRACDILGKNYFSNKRYRAAIPYLEQSCKREMKFACEALGSIYRDGHDVRPDDIKSRLYYEEACRLKSGDSCFGVAIIYRGGFGVKKDRKMEKLYYKKACDVGVKVGCERYTEFDNEDKGIEVGIWATVKSWFNESEKTANNNSI